MRKAIQIIGWILWFVVLAALVSLPFLLGSCAYVRHLDDLGEGDRYVVKPQPHKAYEAHAR